MNKELTRTTNPLTELMEWLDLGGPRGRRGLGLVPDVRVEDYVEDGGARTVRVTRA